MRKILSVLCAVLLSVTMIFCKPIPRVEASSAVAGYTAYEIISLIMAVCGGGVLHATQGLLGDITYDPAQMYNSMNTYQSGLGDILSSYVARGSYLGAGSYLRINEADFEAFRAYFANNDVQSVTGQSVTVNQFASALNEFAGFNTYAGQGQFDFVRNNTDIVALTWINGGERVLFLLKSDKYSVVDQENNKRIYLYQPNTFTYASAGGRWWQYGNGSSWEADTGTIKAMHIIASVAPKYNTAVYDVSKAGKLDNISRTRKYNSQTQEYEGDVSIAMPRVEVLDEVLAQEDISGLYDAINAYPVNTADDTMVLYPSASATDFAVPEISINQTIAFPAIDGTASNYTMDLTSFFPFCIPFDIVAFIQLFEADAQAPSVTYPFPYVTSSGQIGTVEQTISLSQFDGVATLVRRLELIAFIIGLAVVTRSWFLRG